MKIFDQCNIVRRLSESYKWQRRDIGFINLVMNINRASNASSTDKPQKKTQPREEQKLNVLKKSFKNVKKEIKYKIKYLVPNYHIEDNNQLILLKLGQKKKKNPIEETNKFVVQLLNFMHKNSFNTLDSENLSLLLQGKDTLIPKYILIIEIGVDFFDKENQRMPIKMEKRFKSIKWVQEPFLKSYEIYEKYIRQLRSYLLFLQIIQEQLKQINSQFKSIRSLTHLITLQIEINYEAWIKEKLNIQNESSKECRLVQIKQQYSDGKFQNDRLIYSTSSTRFQYYKQRTNPTYYIYNIGRNKQQLYKILDCLGGQ